MVLKTISSTEVWRKGDIAIFELQMEYEGKPVRAKTYSEVIAKVGWEGDCVTYEKQGRNGPEQFVKQVPKENTGYSSTTVRSSRGSGAGSYTPRDDSHIKAQWAIGQAMGFATAINTDGKVDFDLVEGIARSLFTMVDRVKAPQQTVIDTVHDADGPIDTKVIDDIFNQPIETEDSGELPWATPKQ